MKLKEAISVQLLAEAARFGNREMKLIEKYSNDFRVGVEYEFIYDEEILEDEVEVEDEVTDYDTLEARDPTMAREIYLEIQEQILDEYVEEEGADSIGVLADAYDSVLVSSRDVQKELENLVRNYNGEDSMDLVDVEVALEELESALEEYSDAIDELDPEIVKDAYENIIDTNSSVTAISRYLRIQTDVEKARQSLDALKENPDDKKYIDELDLFYADQFGNEISPLPRMRRADAFEFRNAIRIEIDEKDLVSEEVEERITDLIQTGSLPQIQSVEGGVADFDQAAVELATRNWMGHPKVENVHGEHMDRGVEVTTRPLKLDEQFDFMQDMFLHIKQNGETNDETGMHVNLSHKNLGNEREFNPVKLIALIDPDFMQRMDNGFIGQAPIYKWKKRNHMVAALMEKLDQQTIYSIAKDYEQNPSFLYLEKLVKQQVIKSDKFRSINFTYLLGGTPSARRIEYRFFGGEDYEKRFDEIKRDTYFLCYTMLAATERKFLFNEYAKSLLRLLDRAAKQHWRMSFLDLVKAPDEDLV